MGKATFWLTLGGMLGVYILSLAIPKPGGIGQTPNDASGNLGGGGPGNAGASPVQQFAGSAAFPTPQLQPSWFTAYPLDGTEASTPNLAGIPANNFRQLGDTYGGRA